MVGYHDQEEGREGGREGGREEEEEEGRYVIWRCVLFTHIGNTVGEVWRWSFLLSCPSEQTVHDG